MSLSIWRYAHLVLAIFSCSFLLVASTTGVVLAYDAAKEKYDSYSIKDLENITISESIQILRKSFIEITEIAVDHNDAVYLEGFDKTGNNIKAYINPINGKILGFTRVKSEFINWITALHRSLFLKETGRFIVGFVSFILFFISVSGLILIIKRQQKLRNFFDKIKKDFFWQYFHVVSGRLLLLPIIVISLTGTYLFMLRFNLISQSESKRIEINNLENDLPKEAHEFEIFKNTSLKSIKKLEFPFLDGDKDDFFILKLKDREIYINQINGEIEREEKYPLASVYEELSLVLHTGRGNITWAIILGLSSLNIIFFIYSGFAITLKRTRNKLYNRYKPEDSEFIILIGSENGSTISFASNIHSQLINFGKKSYIAELNQYKIFPNAKYFLIFTSTYGVGTAPNNAKNFANLVQKIKQNHNIKYSIVGFGSKSYKNFCKYAIELDNLLFNCACLEKYLDIYTVNDKSSDEFCSWVKAWNDKNEIKFAVTPSLYNLKISQVKNVKVYSENKILDENNTFKILLKPSKLQKFRSGDLFAIYPDNDHKERLYSIGKIGKYIQLIVKFHEKGLGSEFLYNLKKSQKIGAKIIKNTNFYVPKKAKKIIMISNGTGIAPFLGMINENTKKIEMYLYCGFRRKSFLTQEYQYFASENIKQNKLKKFHFTYSKDEERKYVTELIKENSKTIMSLLKNGAYIMICGSMKMQEDVIEFLENLHTENNESFQNYKEQILTDCY